MGKDTIKILYTLICIVLWCILFYFHIIPLMSLQYIIVTILIWLIAKHTLFKNTIEGN